MYRKLMKRGLAAAAAALTALSLCACDEKKSERPTVPEVTGEFDFSVLKVGQADAIILKTENHSVIIDCGESDDGGEVADYLSDNGIGKVDYLFITHFDKDHVGGVPEVLGSGVEVGRIITPKYEGTCDEYEHYAEYVEENGFEPEAITKDFSFTLDDVLFEVFAPQRSSYAEDDNDFSIAVDVTHGENTFLFTGDAESMRLSEIMEQTGYTKHAFLQVPHHGKYNHNSKKFFETVDPDYAVITCSDKNPAESQTLDALGLVCENVYLTSGGDISVKSDGKEITVSQ